MFMLYVIHQMVSQSSQHLSGDSHSINKTTKRMAFCLFLWTIVSRTTIFSRVIKKQRKHKLRGVSMS